MCSYVVVGGGSGSYAILRPLHTKVGDGEVGSVVTVTDNGSRTGSWRKYDHNLPAIGDARHALEAYARNSPRNRQLNGHGFLDYSRIIGLRIKSKKSKLNGTVVGNDLLAAIARQKGSNLAIACDELCDMLSIKSRVYPASIGSAHLQVEFDDGSTMYGEDWIDTRNMDDPRMIVKASIIPTLEAYLPAVDVIMNAKMVIIASGSPWTSTAAVLLIDGIAKAIKETPAKVVYVCNLMTTHTESRGFKVHDFAAHVFRLIGGRKFDAVLCHDPRLVPDDYASTYFAEGAEMTVRCDDDEEEDLLSFCTKRIVIGNYMRKSKGKIRHNEKVVEDILSL